MAIISKLANFFLSRKQDFRETFSGRAGERVLGDLLKECQIDRDPTVPGDQISTGVNIGRQNVGRFILNYLHVPDEEIIRRVSQHEKEKHDGLEIEDQDNL